MNMMEQYRRQAGTLPLCEALNIPRASFYRQQVKNATIAPVVARQRPEHALSQMEQQTVLATHNCGWVPGACARGRPPRAQMPVFN